MTTSRRGCCSAAAYPRVVVDADLLDIPGVSGIAPLHYPRLALSQLAMGSTGVSAPRDRVQEQLIGEVVRHGRLIGWGLVVLLLQAVGMLQHARQRLPAARR